MAQSPKKVFISYSRENRDFAERLVGSLRASGLEVWFDKQIRTGTEWDEVLEQQIKNADHLVIVLSKHSVESDYVKNEMFYAQQNNTMVNLIMIEECSLPLAMARMHYIDFTEGYDRGVERLVADITYDKALKAKSVANIRSTKKSLTPNKYSKTKNLVIGFASLAGAFLLFWFFWMPWDTKQTVSTDDGNTQNQVDDSTTSTNDSGWRKLGNSSTIDDYMDYIETYGDDERHFDLALQSIQDLLTEEGAVIMDRAQDDPYFFKYLYFNDGLYEFNNVDDPNVEWPEAGDILVALERIVVLDPETADPVGGVILQPGDYIEYFDMEGGDSDFVLVKFYYSLNPQN